MKALRAASKARKCVVFGRTSRSPVDVLSVPLRKLTVDMRGKPSSVMPTRIRFTRQNAPPGAADAAPRKPRGTRARGRSGLFTSAIDNSKESSSLSGAGLKKFSKVADAFKFRRRPRAHLFESGISTADRAIIEKLLQHRA